MCIMQTCGKWCLHPYNKSEEKQHMEICTARAQRGQSRQITAEQECGICLEPIRDKPVPQQKFGLLSCQHCFCLGCLRGWRAQRDGNIVDSVSSHLLQDVRVLTCITGVRNWDCVNSNWFTFRVWWEFEWSMPKFFMQNWWSMVERRDHKQWRLSWRTTCCKE